MKTEVDYSFKYLLVGDPNVGKTSILQRYTKGKIDYDLSPTVTVDMLDKIVEIEWRKIKLNIYDSPGGATFGSMTTAGFKTSCGILVVYDVTNQDSFDRIENDILSYILDSSPTSSTVILVGNKSDKASERKINTEQGKALAEKLSS